MRAGKETGGKKKHIKVIQLEYKWAQMGTTIQCDENETRAVQSPVHPYQRDSVVLVITLTPNNRLFVFSFSSILTIDSRVLSFGDAGSLQTCCRTTRTLRARSYR